jgi:RNA polymerase sigma factor (sigma-70 family)
MVLRRPSEADGNTMPALGNVLRYLKTITNPAQGTEDGDLLAAYCTRRDGEAFGELVQRYGGMVFGVCRRVLGEETDAEDAFQATFVLLARRAATIDRERPLASWLYTVAYQTALKARARRERRRQVERQAPTRMIAPQSTSAENQDLRAVLDQELLGLAERDRELILLCDIQGKGHRTVAEELRIPAGSISRLLASAREQLRGRLMRRGVSLSAVALGSVLTAEACAVVPPRLALDAIQAALVEAAAMPEAVAELVSAVNRDATLAKVKITAAALAVCATLIGGAAAVVYAVRPAAVIRSTPTDAVALVPTLPAEEDGRGKAVRGLRLVLDAGNGETAMTADAAQTQPIALRLQFKNDGDKPIKIKTTNLLASWEARYEITVTGPDAESVRIEVQDAPPPAPTGFFHTLDAGKTRVAGTARLPGTFPSPDGKARTYHLCKPGRYVVRVRYVNNDKDNLPIADGVWTGTVDSNDCVITVRERK